MLRVTLRPLREFRPSSSTGTAPLFWLLDMYFRILYTFFIYLLFLELLYICLGSFRLLDMYFGILGLFFFLAFHS